MVNIHLSQILRKFEVIFFLGYTVFKISQQSAVAVVVESTTPAEVSTSVINGMINRLITCIFHVIIPDISPEA
jgi:hypothetical protein